MQLYPSRRVQGQCLPVLALSFGILLLYPQSLSGQAAKGKIEGEKLEASNLPARLQAELTKTTEELNRFQAECQPTRLPSGATLDEALEYRALLQRLVMIYQNHLTEVQKLDVLQQRREELDRRITSWSGLPDRTPYSVLLVDKLEENVQSAKAGMEAAKTAGQIANKFKDDYRTLLNRCEENLRLLNEQLENAKDPAVTTHLTWLSELERVRERFAAANAAYSETRNQGADMELAVLHRQLTLAQRQLAIAVKDMAFSRSDLDKILKNLSRDRERMEQEITQARADLQLRQKALAEAGKGLNKGSSDIDRRQDLIELRKAQVQTASRRLEVLRQLADGLNLERTGWEIRYAIFKSNDVAKIQEADARLRRFADRMQLVKTSFRQQADLAAGNVLEQRRRLQSEQGDPSRIKEWMAAFQEQSDIYERAFREALRWEQVVSHWKESLEISRSSLPFLGRVRDMFAGISTFGTRLWNLELYVAEDTIIVDGQPIKGQRSVTLGKVIFALGILVGGYVLSSLAARVVKKVVEKRLTLEEATANLVRRWVKFFLVLALIIVSLAFARIPLTVFAFLGGALAIGVGFGTQTLLKNFISGIILLVERPLRVGDILEVEGTRGQVVAIGIRSSIICTADGIETLIPNSVFLESNVTNWTYSSRHVRFALRVGVAYGSSPRQVTEVLGQVAREHGLVLKNPAPLVLFEDFGDNALLFCLNYWLEVTPKIDPRLVASDLRHIIERRFTQEEIVLSFPQRDVHLDAPKPFQVEILNTPHSKSDSHSRPGPLSKP